MTRELNKISRITGRYRWARGLRACLLGLCLAAGALITHPAWAIRLYLRATDGTHLSGLEWQDTSDGIWRISGSSNNIGATDRYITFIYRGKDVYWNVNASNNQWGMPYEEYVVNPHLVDTNFYFFKYSNTLSVVTTGIVTETNAFFWFLSPAPLLTNSSAYQARYTNTHYGDGAPVATDLNPMPTGAVTIVFSDLPGYDKPGNITTNVAGADPQTVTGVYTRQYGDIHILPQDANANPLTNAPWTITQYPTDYTNSTSGTGEWTIVNAPVGTYTVTFGPVADYSNPSAISKTNAKGVTTDYIGAYTYSGSKLTYVYLRDSASNNISAGQWSFDNGGTWRLSGSSYNFGDSPIEKTFIYNGKDVYWSQGPWGMPYSTTISNPVMLITNFYFQKYSNTLSVVTTGIVSEATAYWSFSAPSAMLTNSSAYQTRYTHLHDGSGAPVSTYLNPLPTGTVTIVFSNVVGYTKPANASVELSGASPQEVTGVYTRQFGDIHILPRDGDGNAISNAAWTITSYPSDYTGVLTGNGETNIVNAPVGEYIIYFSSVDLYGSPTPNPVTHTTTANVTTDFIATYSFTGQKLTVHIVLAGETNANWLIGAGFVQRAPGGMPLADDPESFIYPLDTEVTLTAIPSNIVVDGVTYKSYFFEWTGRRWNGTTWVNNELGSYSSPTRINPITLKMDSDRYVTVLFSREKYPWDNAGDLDGDSLPDDWEIAWGLSPKDGSAVNGTYGNSDLDWIPSILTNAPTVVAVQDDSQSPDQDMAGGVYWVTYEGVDGAIPGYPLRRTRMLTPQGLGVGDQTGYGGGSAFHNLLECRGFDGFYKTNGGNWTSATTFDAYWTPNDDPGTDPKLLDTDDDTFCDGWEYYFWYWRSANAFARGLSNSANLGWVSINPIVANAGNWDTDGDELTDEAEYLLGTDPTHADTDGDSMDDWWENHYELNPLNYSDALDNTDADYMAVRRDLHVLEMTNGITNVVSGTLFSENVLVAVSGSGVGVWLDIDGNNAFTLYKDTVLLGGGALSNGMAGTIIPDVYYGMVSGLPRYLPGYPVWVDTDGDGIYTDLVDLPLINPAIKNELVYMAPPPLFPDGSPGESSFSPLTAWFEGVLAAGYTLTNISVSITWSGPWLTERYNAYQEYLGGDYLGRVSWDAGGRVISENDDRLFPGRTAFTQPGNQDTDSDGIPDGWELYVGLNPNYAADANWNHDESNPFSALANRVEWANLSHPLSRDLAWDTKIWPSDPGVILAPAPNDPHPADTDWDGLDDGQERDAMSCPTLVDSDRDGMPDGWERYAGVDARMNNADADDDHDGLFNWQEYWTGTVPEWQYCDPGWNLNFLSRQISWWDWGWDGGKVWVFLPPDFFTCPSFLYANGIVTDLAALREEFPAAGSMNMANYKTTYAGYGFSQEEDEADEPINPIDSDRDGMDDFWEVFHCLNPLVGFISKIDIGRPAAESWMPLVGVVDAAPGQPGYQVGLPNDPFVYPMDLIDYFRNNVRSLGTKDPARFSAVRNIVGPHCFGCVNNDPDDDGLPNFQEYTYYRNAHLHTCPVPLWRTDSYAGGVYSFIRRNYRAELTNGWGAYKFGGISYSKDRGSVPFRWAAMTEGFDTDNDMIGDYQETTGYRTNGTVAASDPLDDRNPVRNRVLQLDGTNSWGRSYAWSHYGDFSKFSVEAWVLPSRLTSPKDQVIVEKSSGYTVQTPTGPSTVSLANFQLGIGADGVPYILFHGVSGYTTQRASASSLAGQLRPNEWMHLAGVFDGTKLTLYVNGDAAVTHHTTDVPARGIEGNYAVWHPNCNLSVGARELNCGWHFPVTGEKFFNGSIDEVRVWDRALPQSEIILRKNRELTPEEVGTVLGGNNPYGESVNNLFAYYTFNSLPDPAVEGIIPSEYPAGQRPQLSRNFSQIYTNRFLVIAADRIKRIPRLPPLDTRVIGTNSLGGSSSPDSYGIASSNYLDITLPADFRNPANPYNCTHGSFNIDMGRGLWMCGRAQGKKPAVTWMETIDPGDPDSTDADGDGLPDWWEILYGLDPYDATGANGRWGDPDGDGLSNWAEYMANTNPMSWDTDGDGLSDYDSRSDTDPYALTWGELYDDGDGMPDAWESEYGLDPNKDDSHLDKDGDGWSNYAEFLAGTDPASSGSHPSPRVTGSLIYNGQKTGTYRVWGYQINPMDGPEQASQIGLDNTVSEVIGYANGTRSYNGRLPYAPVLAGTAVRIAAIMYHWDGQMITYSYATFTFTGPEEFTYEDAGGTREGVDGRLDYRTGEFSLTWASDEVPAEGNEISVSYPYIDPRNPRFGFSGFEEGEVYLAGILDVNGNNRWDEGEPFGVAHRQPFNLGISDLRDVRIYLHETLPGYPRFKWTLPGVTNLSETNILTHVSVNHTSLEGSPNHFDLYIRAPRDFLHEWDCQRYGIYGLPAGSYRWWAGAQNGTFFINWSLPERTYAVAPRGATLYAARNQFEWTMGTNATMYRLQVARKETDGRLTLVEDQYYPAPGRDRDGICRDYPDSYASDWGNGTYYWRIAAWNPAGLGMWSGDDLDTVQTFNINLNSSYSRTVSGNIYYYGKTAVTSLVVEAFDNIGFSGVPEARLHLTVPRTSDPNKVIPFTIKGLPAGTYYVRAYLDTAPFGGAPSGKWVAWKTQGFVRDNNNWYKPGALALVNTTQLTGRKLVLRDHDSDNDSLPDAWEMEYFGNLNQTGATDFDGDGETNYQEYQYSSGVLNPRLLDSDNDGLTDAFEVHYNGLMYGYQPRAGSPRLNPTVWDSDGDGYSDGAELRRYHTDPLDAGELPYYRPPCYGPSASPADFDGDGRTDAVLFDPFSGTWYAYTMGGVSDQAQFGDASKTPLAGDFDGDGCSDLALYQAASGLWQVLTMSGQSVDLPFGLANMIPVPADYDGDMFTEFGLYDQVTGTWHIYPLNERFESISHGSPTQIPVPGDYDGDGRTDLAVYDPASGVWSMRTWFGQNSNVQWGGPYDVPVPGDYDGDGRTDLAVFNSNTAQWRVYTMQGQALEGQFGWYGVIPVPGDYDGDGRTDAAYYYPPTGMWGVYTMSGQVLDGKFGDAGATPVLGKR